MGEVTAPETRISLATSPPWHGHLARKSPERVFTEIYCGNKWGDKDSVSGAGSNLVETEAIRRALPLVIEELRCRSLLDVPCGDFFWMKLVELDIDYTGGDIVAELVENNQQRYGSGKRKFLHLDLIRDRLPKADLVLCRDGLVHLSYAHIFSALQHIKDSGAEYLLTTTFVDRDRNEDRPTGDWRPLNLEIAPFNFPPPLRLIDETCPQADFQDKKLGLWKTADLPALPG